MYSPYWPLYITYNTSREVLLQYEGIECFSIPITCMFDQMEKENKLLSVLGLKGSSGRIYQL